MRAKEGSQTGVAFFVSLYSLLRDKPTLAGLVVLGEMTIQRNILPVRSLIELLQVIVDNGAKKVLVPVSNKRQFLEVPGDLMERVDPIFYSEPLGAALKAIGVGEGYISLAKNTPLLVEGGNQQTGRGYYG